MINASTSVSGILTIVTADSSLESLSCTKNVVGGRVLPLLDRRICYLSEKKVDPLFKM